MKNNQKVFASIILIAVVILVAVGGYLVINKKADVNVLTAPTPVLTYTEGVKPSVQINFDWNVADRFNIYRSTSESGNYEKIISDFPANAHTAVDYDFPKDATTLYYRITYLDQNGKESNPSEIVSVKTAMSLPSPYSQSNNSTTCKDEQEGIPVITSISSYSGSIGTKLEINGCNFAGFEGDKNAWIENSQGVKGILYGEPDSTSKKLKVTLKSPLCQQDNSYKGGPCDASLALIPGIYKIYVYPWGKESNKVGFTIK